MKMMDPMKGMVVQDQEEIFRLGRSDRFALVAKSLVAIPVVNAKSRYSNVIERGLILVRCQWIKILY